MMEGHDQRDLLLELDDPVAEALVVVHEVELAEAWREVVVDAGAERQRLGEDAERELADLEQVVAVFELPVRREAARILVVEQIEARAAW